jgi:hypothetical protein
MVIKEKERQGVNRIYLSQDMDHWRTFVNTVINSRVP